jgi:hypothetical protein
VTVLEIFKPASQRPVEIDDNRFQTVSVRSFGLGSDGVLQFLEAFLSRPSISSLEMVPQEIKPTPFCGIYDVGLLRMECQPVGRRPSLHDFQRSLGLFLAAAQNHEVE